MRIPRVKISGLGWVFAWLPVLFSLCLSGEVQADSKERKPGVLSSRSSRIDFEGETVEGVNSALDSLNQLGRRDRKKDPHLYRKREHFRDETDQTVMDLGVRP